MTLPSERKALLFSAGGVRLALRLSQVREIVAAPEEGTELVIRGVPTPALPVAIALGLPIAPTPFALVVEWGDPSILRVEALQGIVDLDSAEVFQLPARTQLPQPPPFSGALVTGGAVALDLAMTALGWAPIEPADDALTPPPDAAPSSERELLFARGARTYAVPISLLVQVLDAPRIWPVPLAPRAHVGLLYHGRALHPVFDVALLHGEPRRGTARTVLLLDAGGAAVGIAADRILGVGEAVRGGEALRPAWDALFAG